MSPEVFQPSLLVAKVGHSLLVGRRGEQREVGGGMAEVLAEAGREHGEEEGVSDRKLQITELIGEGLEAQAEGVEGEVVLVEIEELLLEEGDALDLVVGEEVDNLLPHVARGVAVANNSVKDVGGDGLEEPADDGGVDGALVGVVWHGEEVNGAIDVVEEVVLAEEEAKVRLPREEVGRGVGELDRHALEDGNIADDGDGGAGKGVGAPRSRGVEGIGGARAGEVGHGGRKRGPRRRQEEAARLGLGWAGGGVAKEAAAAPRRRRRLSG
jgi:hypothetical protein